MRISAAPPRPAQPAHQLGGPPQGEVRKAQNHHQDPGRHGLMGGRISGVLGQNNNGQQGPRGGDGGDRQRKDRRIPRPLPLLRSRQVTGEIRQRHLGAEQEEEHTAGDLEGRASDQYRARKMAARTSR